MEDGEDEESQVDKPSQTENRTSSLQTPENQEKDAKSDQWVNLPQEAHKAGVWYSTVQ